MDVELGGSMAAPMTVPLRQANGPMLARAATAALVARISDRMAKQRPGVRCWRGGRGRRHDGRSGRRIEMEETTRGGRDRPSIPSPYVGRAEMLRFAAGRLERLGRPGTRLARDAYE
ncbi:MAG TPA: hypothetical protein ENK57_14310 [Polyangiaceae bacterium]|nr:hypothetical protein [Polyangiaceae bacterium]